MNLTAMKKALKNSFSIQYVTVCTTREEIWRNKYLRHLLIELDHSVFLNSHLPAVIVSLVNMSRVNQTS